MENRKIAVTRRLHRAISLRLVVSTRIGCLLDFPNDAMSGHVRMYDRTPSATTVTRSVTCARICLFAAIFAESVASSNPRIAARKKWKFVALSRTL